MRLLFLIALVALSGCRGPLTVPMVERLSPEAQQQVDESWHNMLTPPDRLDSPLLLDVILTNELHQQGVDYLEMTSYKRVDGGLVVTQVRYDINEPAFDEFTVTFTDRRGVESRRERFSRSDIALRQDYYARGWAACSTVASVKPADLAIMTPAEISALVEEQKLAAEFEARQEEIRAATQPAGEPQAPPSGP